MEIGGGWRSSPRDDGEFRLVEIQIPDPLDNHHTTDIDRYPQSLPTSANVKGSRREESASSKISIRSWPQNGSPRYT
jgi:hypothetical protein